jgi:hypothetical protein
MLLGVLFGLPDEFFNQGDLRAQQDGQGEYAKRHSIVDDARHNENAVETLGGGDSCGSSSEV